MTRFYEVFVVPVLRIWEKRQDVGDLHVGIFLESKVGTIAAPGVILRRRDHLCLKRISMNVAADIQHVFLRKDQLGTVTALKHMTDVLVFFVNIVGILAIQKSHDFVDGGFNGFQLEMDVVRHQAIGE